MTESHLEAHELPDERDPFPSRSDDHAALRAATPREDPREDSREDSRDDRRDPLDENGEPVEREAGASEASTPDGEAASGERPRRRRGSRGGRRRRGRATPESAAGAAADPELDGQHGAPELPRLAARAAHDPDLDRSPREIDADPEVDPDGAREREPSASVAPVDDGSSAGRKRSRRGRRGRGRRGRDRDAEPGARPIAAESDVEADAGAVEPLPLDDDGFLPRPSAVPRELDSGDEPEAETERGGPGAPEDGRKKRRRRGRRGGRGRTEAGPLPARTPARAPRRAPATPLDVEAIPGEDDDFPTLPELPPETELLDAEVEVAPTERRDAPGGRKRRRRGEKRPARERVAGADAEALDDDEPQPVPESQRNALILVNATDPEEQRVAVVENERIVDFQMTVKDQDSLVNDIYRGRVVNLEPAIGAAFIDFGQGRNGFLHTSDVLSVYGDRDWSLDKLTSTQMDAEEWEGEGGGSQSSEDVDDEAPAKRDSGGRKHRRPRPEQKRRFRARPRLPITDLLKKGQMVVVQVTKDAIGDKGPTLTTYISIPGRYLVLMPSMSRTGVSRKIEDERERKRLKRILQALEVPTGMGVIVRTAGVGHTKAEIKRDLDYLSSAWEAFGKRLASGNGPAPLYRESDVAIRTMRDMFTPQTKAVVVDDPEVHRHICEFTEKLMPENVERVKLHQGSRPLFQSYGIEPDFEKIFARRIELPSGGSIVFDQAEALVAIDVNSGRTRSDGFDFEEIALKTNLEAVPEIARQIRLRDLGGIIVVDFIDMMKLGNMRTVERAFQVELDKDRARSKVGRISQFGLLELTRQRLGPGMNKKAFHSCPRCRGTGRIRTVNSRAAAILRRLASAMTLKGFSTCEVRAHPEVVRYLKDSCSEYIRALEYRFQREVKLLDAPDQVEDSVLRYLRADGKEVRAGGRRKR